MNVGFAMETKDCALVLEGGGFRGVFTAGVLDALMEAGVVDFRSVFGVSAGAINAVSFKSGQLGRNIRIMLAFRDDRRFMSLFSLVTTGNITGGEFLYEDIQNVLDPCNYEAFNRNPTQMFAVATDVVFGTPAYFEIKSLPEDISKVRSSASLPLLSQNVEIDGGLYLDGGTADSIPFEVALGINGAEELPNYTPTKKALVVLTRDRNYIKTNTNEMISVRSHRYDGYPYYIDSLSSRYERYNQCRDRLFALEQEENSPVFVLAPEKPTEVNTNEHRGDKLLDLYLQGRAVAEKHMDEIREFYK